MLPNRGERYRGPQGEVEVVAVDGAVEGKVTVQPAGGGQQFDIPLEEWRHNYVYQPGDINGMKRNEELTAAARRGFEDRVAGRPPSPRPEGAKESDQVAMTSGRPAPSMTHQPAKVVTPEQLKKEAEGTEAAVKPKGGGRSA